MSICDIRYNISVRKSQTNGLKIIFYYNNNIMCISVYYELVKLAYVCRRQLS